MKKIKKKKILSRNTRQRIALLKTLLVSLAKNKSIKTTLAKAKALRPFAERQLTQARIGVENKEQKIIKFRFLSKILPLPAVRNLFEIAENYKNVSGGYLRIIKLPRRNSDMAEMAKIEWTKELIKEGKDSKKDKKKGEKTEEKKSKK